MLWILEQIFDYWSFDLLFYFGFKEYRSLRSSSKFAAAFVQCNSYIRACRSLPAQMHNLIEYLEKVNIKQDFILLLPIVLEC